MAISALRLIKNSIEFCPAVEMNKIPHKIRGLYVLYKKRRNRENPRYDVVYVGIAFGEKVGGIHGRIKSHAKHKEGKWTHFSIYEVWDNVRMEEVKELEGLLRHIYRKDTNANKLNVVGGFNKLRKTRVKNLSHLGDSQ